MTTDTPTAKVFNPSEHLIQLQGKDYLQVMWRLVWLRTEHPDAVIVTERLGFDDQFAMFRASVTIPGGGSATAHGMETQSDFHDYAEKAETKAVGRALGMLGYGTQFAPELDEGARIVDSPVQRPQATPAPSPAPQRPAAAPARPAAPPAPAQGPRKAAQPTGGVPAPANLGEVMQLAADRKGMSFADVLNFFAARRVEEIRITPAAAWAKLDHERPDKVGAALFEPEAPAK